MLAGEDASPTERSRSRPSGAGATAGAGLAIATVAAVSSRVHWSEIVPTILGQTAPRAGLVAAALVLWCGLAALEWRAATTGLPWRSALAGVAGSLTAPRRLSCGDVGGDSHLLPETILRHALPRELDRRAVMALRRFVDVATALLSPPTALLVLAIADPFEFTTVASGTLASAVWMLLAALLWAAVRLGGHDRGTGEGNGEESVAMAPWHRLVVRLSAASGGPELLRGVPPSRWFVVFTSRALVVCAEFILFLLCVRAVGTPTAALANSELAAVALLTRSAWQVSGTRGGIGVTDAVLVVACASLGGSAFSTQWFAGALFFRVCTLVVPALAGAVRFRRRQSANLVGPRRRAV